MSTQEANYGTIQDFEAKNFDKKFVFVGMNYSANPAMKGVNYGTSMSIPGTAVIFDEKEKRLRNIRYVPGSKTIFEDEMEFESIADMEKKTQKLLFIREHTNDLCKLVVDGKDQTLLKYVILSPYNHSSPNRDKEKRPLYWMLDLQSSIKQAADSLKSTAKAIAWCFEPTPWDEVYAYARVLIGDVSGHDSNEVRYNLSLLAAKNPEKFMAGLASDLTKKKFLVQEAIDKGIIAKTHNTLTWANGAPIIAPVAIGKDPVDVLVDSNDANSTIIFTAIKNELYKGKETYRADAPGLPAAQVEDIAFLKEQVKKQNEMIEQLVKNGAKPVEDMNFIQKKDSKPSLIADNLTDEEKFRVWVESAKNRKIFRQAASWFFFDTNPEIAAFNQEKVQGLKELMKLLFETRPEMYDAMKKIMEG